MTFWLPASLLALVALAFVLPALLRHVQGGPDVNATRLSVYRHRLKELENDHAAGTLDEVRYREARDELEAAAALELEEGAATQRYGGAPPWATALALVVLVPVLAAVLYTRLGGLDEPMVDMPTETGHEHDLVALVGQLAERMEAQPDDLQGWMLLGRSSVAIGDLERAVHAWREALRLAGQDDPVVLANLAEAIGLTDPEGLSGEASPLLERALELDPENPKALYYGAMLAFERAHPRLAVERLRRLLTLDPPDELRGVVRRHLVRETGIELEIGIAPELEDAMPDLATLFVSARGATDGPPVAATRRDGLGPLPLRVVLSDMDLMRSDGSLLDHDTLELTARITTAAGSAERRPGDLVGTLDWNRRRADDRVMLVIDEVVGRQ